MSIGAVAFLCTDIEGSAAPWEHEPAALQAAHAWMVGQVAQAA